MMLSYFPIMMKYVFFFVKYPLFTYLINHINVSGLPFSRIKRFFLQMCVKAL